MTLGRLEWDEAKAAANLRKHRVDFRQAAQVFLDPLHVSRQDRIEGGEDRWRTVGLVGGFVIIVVAHTLREEDEGGAIVEVIRIISARRADKTERRRYEDEND